MSTMSSRSATQPRSEFEQQQNTSLSVDLRSDTVTRPTPEMRRAMAEAVVGDDVYGEDPTMNLLQSRAAEIFGRPEALLCPPVRWAIWLPSRCGRITATR